MTVAALYVQTGGVYYGLEDVEPWDEARDARLYAGPHPVVAHPPCNKWSPLAYINQRRLPNYHYGDDGGCFEAALEAVRAYGGVLEHPAHSGAWRHFHLQRPWPIGAGWTTSLLDDAWVCAVSQAAYGHRAFKETWLYYVGPDPPTLYWSAPSVTGRISDFTHGAARIAADRVRPREASATPPAFRDILLDMARSASPVLQAREGTGTR